MIRAELHWIEKYAVAYSLSGGNIHSHRNNKKLSWRVVLKWRVTTKQLWGQDRGSGEVSTSPLDIIPMDAFFSLLNPDFIQVEFHSNSKNRRLTSYFHLTNSDERRLK